MPKADRVTAYRSLEDPAELAACAALAGSAMTKFGCRFMYRGNAVMAFETDPMERVVVAGFPSLADAVAARQSPDSEVALDALGGGAGRDMRFVEGVE